jgi:hypothetical protein
MLIIEGKFMFYSLIYPRLIFKVKTAPCHAIALLRSVDQIWVRIQNIVNEGDRVAQLILEQCVTPEVTEVSVRPFVLLLAWLIAFH